MKNRAEHLQWCKYQAYKQYEYDMSGKEYSNPELAFANAIASMMSDLSKHLETMGSVEACFILAMTVHDYDSLKKFIDGFN